MVLKHLYLLDLLWHVGGLGTHIIGIEFLFMEAKKYKVAATLVCLLFWLTDDILPGR